MDAQHIFIALTNPAPGREAEFNQFYDDIHVPDVLGSQGWVAAQRYRLSSEQRPDQSPPWMYLAVYEVTCPEGEILAPLKLRPDVGPQGRPAAAVGRRPPGLDLHQARSAPRAEAEHLDRLAARTALLHPHLRHPTFEEDFMDHGHERGWHRYGFNNQDFDEQAHPRIRCADRGAPGVLPGVGEPHVSFGVIPPNTDSPAIGMHIYRDVPTNTDVEEWYIIVDGEGEMTFSNGDVEKCGPGDLVAIYPGTGHSFRATGEKPLRLISITPLMYTTKNPVTPMPDAFAPTIVVGEVDDTMNPFDATCSCCASEPGPDPPTTGPWPRCRNGPVPRLRTRSRGRHDVRLGGMMYRPANVAELDALIETFDTFGLSTVVAPMHFADMTDDDAVAYGDHARGRGLTIGRGRFRPNLMIRDTEIRTQRIEQLRRGLRKADLMRADSVVILVGTVGEEDHLAAPHPYMFTDECRAEFRDVLLRALDGLELRRPAC